MNHAYVIDASAAIKCFLDEEFSDRAQALLEESRRSRRPLFAAPHLASAYDSVYSVLADMLEAEFWTDDRRLLNCVEGVAHWVRWVGDYPLDA